MKNSSPKKLSADCWPTVSAQDKALQYVAASFRSALPERLRGDWSLKKPKQYGGLKWESFISRRYAMFFPASWGFSGIWQGFSTDTWPTNYRHVANSRPTNGPQSADCWQKIFVKAVNDSRPTVGRLSANSGPTIGQQLADCRPTVA